MRYIIILLFVALNVYSQDTFRGIHTLKVEDNYIGFRYEAVYTDTAELNEVLRNVDLQLYRYEGLQNIEKHLNTYYYKNNIDKLILFSCLVVLSEKDIRLLNLDEDEQFRYIKACVELLYIDTQNNMKKAKKHNSNIRKL